MIILHTYTDQNPEDQISTLHGMINLAIRWPRSVESIHCSNDESYYEALLKYWGKGNTIVNIEQDIEFMPIMVDRFYTCSEPLCTYPYQLRDRWSVYSIGDGAKLPLDTAKWYSFSERLPDYAEGSGLGFVKIGLEAQVLVNLKEYPVSEYKWWYLDTWLSYKFHKAGLKFHVHKMTVKHHHKY